MAIVPVYVSEICQPKIRAFASSFITIGFSLGYSLTAILGAAFAWRNAVALYCFIPLLTTLGILFCPETPIWLLKNRPEEEVIKVLNVLRGDEN